MTEQIRSAHVNIEEAATDSVCIIHCPYCGCERDVEADAYYTCECESCGKKYRVVGCI